MPRLSGFDYEKFSASFPKKTRWTLRPTRALLRTLKFKQRFRAVHVAGTNGKGSVAAFLDSILRTARLRSGLYTSPHLARFNERVRVNGVEISDAELSALWRKTQLFTKKRNARRGEKISEFEAGTALALKFFESRRCDYAVVETGMGGRLDSTNALSSKNKVAVITRISIDHAAELGNSVSKIAREKAAIIKRGCAAAIALESGAASLSVLRARAKKEGVPLFVVGASRGADVVIKKVKATPRGTIFELSGVFGRTRLETKLLGAHQAENAALAWTTAKILQRQDSRITDAAIRKGIASATWPGRLEIVECKSRSPLVVFDGCHNPGGAKALAKSLKQLWPKRERAWTLVFAAMRDKDYASVLKTLSPLAKTIVATSVAGNERSASAEEIKKAARRFCKNVFVVENAGEALAEAKKLAGSNGCVIVCGSLYLIGELKRRQRWHKVF